MNAKDELLKQIAESESSICCARIFIENASYEIEEIASLCTNHSKEDLVKFFDDLNFDYDNGYGSQNVYGTVWLNDGTWLDRGEYDGSEWWEHRKAPEIPVDLK